MPSGRLSAQYGTWKDTPVSETKEFRKSYILTSTSRDSLKIIMDSIECYRGKSDHPRWKDIDSGEPCMHS